MSEVMQIDATEKKLSKSEAVRQAFATLGIDSDPAEVQQHAEKSCGKEIDIHVVYQIKSNMKTGRDASTKGNAKVVAKAAPKAPKAPKVVKPKAVKQPKADYVENHDNFGDFNKLCKLLDLVKEFGGPVRFMEVINKIAV